MDVVAHPALAMVLGGASCVWEDVGALETLCGAPWDGLVIAANDIACHWAGPLHHWVSLHPEKFPTWRARRAANGRPPTDAKCWGPGAKADHEADGRIQPWSGRHGENGGSSGLLAAQLALEQLACHKVVLCGVPMTPTGHFRESGESFDPAWMIANEHWPMWGLRLKTLAPAVRSMSGRTRRLLGAPTVDWLVAP